MDTDLTGRCGTCSFFMAITTNADGIREGECRLECWPAPLLEIRTCAHHKAKGAAWSGALKRKSAAGTPRNKREDAAEPVKKPLPQEIDIDMDQDEFRSVLRQVIQEELGLSEIELGDRWRGGEVILKPGREGVQSKSLPIDALFKKIVSIRDKLRVLEQKVNANKAMNEHEKVQLQQYITGCYGSLTSFNVLFKNPDEGFSGQSSGS